MWEYVKIVVFLLKTKQEAISNLGSQLLLHSRLEL